MNTLSDVEVVDACSVRMVDTARVAAARAAMPAEDQMVAMADIFGMVSDPGRLRLIVAPLVGELCVCDLAAATGASESATSHGLRLLRAARVVRVRRSGRMAYYSLADGHVRSLVGVALAHTGPLDDDHRQRPLAGGTVSAS